MAERGMGRRRRQPRDAGGPSASPGASGPLRSVEPTKPRPRPTCVESRAIAFLEGALLRKLVPLDPSGRLEGGLTTRDSQYLNSDGANSTSGNEAPKKIGDGCDLRCTRRYSCTCSDC